jgi:flagellar biosynthesis component FlhA
MKVNKAIIFVLAVILAMLIIPMPGLVLDILIAFNLFFALVILLIVINTKKATDFSSYPTIVLWNGLKVKIQCYLMGTYLERIIL